MRCGDWADRETSGVRRQDVAEWLGGATQTAPATAIMVVEGRAARGSGAWGRWRREGMWFKNLCLMLAAVLALAFSVSCSSPPRRPDKEGVGQRADQKQHDLRRDLKKDDR